MPNSILKDVEDIAREADAIWREVTGKSVPQPLSVEQRLWFLRCALSDLVLHLKYPKYPAMSLHDHVSDNFGFLQPVRVSDCESDSPFIGLDERQRAAFEEGVGL